jgi:manganese/iron transport system substrate-binding protein
LQPGADPHVYEPVPADSIAFEQADLILYNGYNLEPNLIRLLNAAGVNARQFAVGEVVPPLDLETGNSAVPDPHVWGDVSNAAPMVEAIRDQLIELAPDQEALFTQNAAAYIDELNQLHTWIEAQTATIPPDQRQLVTTPRRLSVLRSRLRPHGGGHTYWSQHRRAAQRSHRAGASDIHSGSGSAHHFCRNYH